MDLCLKKDLLILSHKNFMHVLNFKKLGLVDINDLKIFKSKNNFLLISGKRIVSLRAFVERDKINYSSNCYEVDIFLSDKLKSYFSDNSFLLLDLKNNYYVFVSKEIQSSPISTFDIQKVRVYDKFAFIFYKNKFFILGFGKRALFEEKVPSKIEKVKEGVLLYYPLYKLFISFNPNTLFFYSKSSLWEDSCSVSRE